MPTVPAVTLAAYDRLPDQWRDGDEQAGWPLLAIVAGLMEPDADLWDLIEDPESFLDPATVDADWLPLIATMNGARLTDGMSVAQQRAEVGNPTGWRRAKPDSIREAATQYLPTSAEFLFLERSNPSIPGDEPAHITMLVHSADVAPGDEAAILDSFQATIPVGMFGHLRAVGQWWTEEAAAHATWAASAGAHSTWADLAGGD